MNNEQLQQVNADMYSIVAKVVLLENRFKKATERSSQAKTSQEIAFKLAPS
ncbi:hypothetical protein ACLGE0_00670 [Helicobacter pylori]